MRGAIFDLDGTLLDSMSIWDTLAEDYLRSLGIEPRENLTEKFKEFTLAQSAQYYIREYGVNQTAEEIIRGIDAMIARFYAEAAPLKEGVKDFLERLRGAGVKMCIATTTGRALAEAALRHNGVDRYFEFILSCGEGGYSKCEPAIYEEALRRLGTEKAATVVFEDAPHAAETARRGGFPVCGVHDAAWNEADCAALKAHADWYIESFRDVGEVLA